MGRISAKLLDYFQSLRLAQINRIRSIIMGKGDRKTAKGKRYNCSYGNARPKAVSKTAGTAAAPVAKKAAGKKTVAKKTVKAA